MAMVKNREIRPIAVLANFIVLLWAVEGVNLLFGHALNQWGILPRTPQGLVGIPLHPLLHGSITHLAFNTGPLLALGILVQFEAPRRYIQVTGFIVLFGGLGLWLVGRPAYHVGASGLIFGYFGYLVTRGVTGRRFRSLAISLIVVFAYGGMIWGVMPTVARVSWEGHLCGLSAGVAAARMRRSA